ncbi:MAG: hypothetical protein AAGE52_13870 [Myxococcota bacterium]
MMVRIALALSFVLGTAVLAQRFPAPPAHNDPRQETPPPRPSAESAQERAEILFRAIVADDPEAGLPFFMAREVFRQIKGVADPDRFYDRMLRLFHRDVHALHAELGEDAERAEFVRLELSRRRGWVGLREESNRLPYWAQRHNWLYYRVGDEERRFKVRTMNSWDGEWYITHLSEFR